MGFREIHQRIKLSDHFTYGKLIRFTMPSIAMMIFTSIYGVVDGFFVSNFVGKTPFAAVNFIMPFLMMLGALGFMFGTGGSALVSCMLGAGEEKKANRVFSLLIYVSAIAGTVIAVLGIVFLPPVAKALGAEGQLLEDSIVYGRIILAALPAYILQLEFQSFFVTAEKPKMGLWVTVIVGVTNMVLDGLMVLPFGLIGAALATAISQIIGGVVPLIYFAKCRSGLLRLGKAEADGKALINTCTNGFSELISNVSMSLVGMLYNAQLLRYAGENGVAAYGAIMYVNFVFQAAFIGYSIGTSPVIGFHYGAENHKELQSLLRKSGVVVGVCSVAMVLMGVLLATPFSALFVGYDLELLDMTVHGFRVFAASFPFAGYAIFCSGFFTALNDGLTSAVISFLRTLVFQTGAVILLPILWGIDGIWWSVVMAEAMAVLVGGVFLIGKRKQYHYL